MTAAVSLDTRVNIVPTVTLSTLAKATGPIRPHELVELLRSHKYPASGPIRSYQLARKQAIDLFVDQKPLDPKLALRPHERDAVNAMIRMRLRRPFWVVSAPQGRRATPWKLGGVIVSMQPDVELEGPMASGAVKFSFTKTPLAPGVGSTMATLMWHWLRNVVGNETVQPGRCFVYEPRLPWTYAPTHAPHRQVRSAELASRVIEALWSTL